MKYAGLGKSDLKPSAVGLGTAHFGEVRWGYDTTFHAHDVIEIVETALDAGINVFDTSETYGNFGGSERLLGSALRRYKRDEFILITKAAPWDLRHDDLLKAAERSLRRLGVTYLDLYLIHHPNPLIPLSETMRAMESLVRMGKIRYIGVSNFGSRLLRRALECLSAPLTANEIEYSVFSRRNERSTISYCRQQNIGVIAFSPLAGGTLSTRYRNVRDRPRAFNFYARASFQRKAERTFRVLQRLALEKGVTVAQVALAWLIAHPIPPLPIPAALSVSDVREDAASCEVELSVENVTEINMASVGLDRLTYAFDTYVVRPAAWIKELARYMIHREPILSQAT